MSVVEHPYSRFPEFTIESGNGKYDMVAKMINSKNKCCANCKYFDDDYCGNGVTNDEFGESIDYKDTFYCSYHKLRINNE